MYNAYFGSIPGKAQLITSKIMVIQATDYNLKKYLDCLFHCLNSKNKFNYAAKLSAAERTVLEG